MPILRRRDREPPGQRQKRMLDNAGQQPPVRLRGIGAGGSAAARCRVLLTAPRCVRQNKQDQQGMESQGLGEALDVGDG